MKNPPMISSKVIDSRTTTYLKEALKLIEDPSRWCQGRLAVTSSEYGCLANDPLSQSAHKFCAVGALMRVMGATDGSDLYHVLSYLGDAARLQGRSGAPEVNDQLGHSAVLELYKVAIQSSRSH